MKTDTWSVANTKLVTIIKDIFQGKNEIKKFGVINGFTKKFSHSLNTEEENFFKLNRTQYTVQFIAWICAVISDVIPMGIGLIMVVNHIAGVEISTIVTLSLSADAVVGSVREFANYQTQITSTSSIRTFMTYNIKKIGSNSFKEKTKNISLYLKNIAFYRQKKLVFKDINLELNDDQKVIITGDSGVGKSTLLQIIAGQLMPSKGGILFNGHKIAIEDSVLISQKPWLFEGTVKENLTLYQDFPESALVQTLKDVRLWDELGTDPLNYKIESTGINVSGGQAQRLAIARGLLRNKQLFLLDEITASLDKENAYKIRKLIYELPVMVIEVAHNIDNELVKNYSIRINVLTKNGLKNE
ncbi:MAG: ATP-binding cassette domain-containing protein [Lactobacillus crispatus]